jgi:hypothetical protein
MISKLTSFETIDERSFERPDEFIPERWTECPELVKDRSVFIPFLIGETLYVMYLGIFKLIKIQAQMLVWANDSL